MKRMKTFVRYGAMILIMLSMLCQTVIASKAPDTKSPTAPKGLTVTDRTHTTISLSWTSSSDDTKVKGYQIYKDGKKITTTTKTTYMNKDLVPGMKYTYHIKAYDAAGNLSESSSAVNAVTISDTQNPSAPGDLTATSLTYTTASLTWKPSTDNVGVKGYEIYCNGKKIASVSAAFYECKRLTPGATYTFYIKAYDKAGNYSAQSNLITTATSADKAAPSTPDELKASSVTLTEVNLTWEPASDNVSVKGYDILRDGVKIGSTTKTSYCNKSLIPGKSYTYTVRASDASGNLSGSSQSLEVTTLKDTQPPTAPTGLKVTDIKGSSVYLAWTASKDNAKIAGYQIYCNGLVISTAARTSRVVKSPFGMGSDVFWIKAYDQAGNLSGSSNTVSAVTLSD